MNESMFQPAGSDATLPTSGRIQVRMNFLLMLVFAGIAAGAIWYGRNASRNPNGETGGQSAGLSPSTREVLGRLESPVEIRFYALLDPASVPAPVAEFAGRVSQLLAEYEGEANGKIVVSRFDSPSDASASAASLDGVQPFNRDQGDACYLGLAVSGNGRRETLPLLHPEWEQALEADLSRAIGRVAQAVPETRALTKPSGQNAAVIEAVKRALPNLDQLTVEQGTQTLRLQALAESQAYARETEAKIKEVEQRFNQAQQSGSEADQQAVLKELQQLHGEKIGKLQEIAAQTQDRIDALAQLKNAGK